MQDLHQRYELARSTKGMAPTELLLEKFAAERNFWILLFSLTLYVVLRRMQQLVHEIQSAREAATHETKRD